MSDPPGQAAETAPRRRRWRLAGLMAKGAARASVAEAGRTAGHCARLVHRACQLLLALLIAALVAVSALTLRLSQGPLDVGFVSRRFAEAASDATRSVTIGDARLAWAGWQSGLREPLILVLHDVAVTSPAGRPIASVPQANVAVSLLEVLRGRVALRALELDGLRITALPTAAEPPPPSETDGPDTDKAASLIHQALQALAQPPRPGVTRADQLWSELRRLRIHDAALTVHDHALGLDGGIEKLDITLDRAAGGGGGGQVAFALKIGPSGEAIGVHARLALLPQDGSLAVTLHVDPFTPSTALAASPALAPAALLGLPIELAGTLRLTSKLTVQHAALDVIADQGVVQLGQGVVPVRNALIHATGSSDQLDVQILHLVLQPPDSGAATTVSGHAVVSRSAAGDLAARISIDLDHASMDTLPKIWPPGIGGPGTRPWLVANVPVGQISRGHVALELTAPADLSDATVTHIEGGLDAADVTLYWLAPIPPIEHASAHLSFTDPDTIDITITGGRQQNTQLLLKQAKLRLTGIAGHDQFLAVDGMLGGPFADVVSVLRHPRIHLLDRRPIPLANPAGSVSSRITVSLPLKNELDMDNVAIHATGQLTDGHAGGMAAGRDLDHATINFDVANDGMKLDGAAEIAALPAQFTVAMDFRGGPPSQVLEKVDATAVIAANRLTTLGANPMGAITGSLAGRLSYQERRNGEASLAVSADLAKTGIADKRVDWHKAIGTQGSAEAAVRLKAGRLIGIDRLAAQAPGLTVQASGETRNGEASLLRIDRLVVGNTTDIGGTLRLPSQPGQPYEATLTGHALDIAGLLTHSPDRDAASGTSAGPAYRVDAHIDRLTLANATVWTAVAAHVENNGAITSNATLDAASGTHRIGLSILPDQGGRALQARADDAGALIAALDLDKRMVGGTLSADGRFDDTTPAHSLSGTVTIQDFRLQNAPAVGRLLQAMSLYGLVEVAQGPGLGFTRLTAPFTLMGDTLTFTDLRSFSSSLGFTAKGTLDLARHAADIQGTVIPIYALNSLLGRLPVIGKLFSPEAGGGLFALAFNITGSLDDPRVTVNPLSALTPGVLRRFFDIFKESPPGTVPPASPATPSGAQN